MQVSLKKSVTLVELIISITLLGVIILGAVAFHLSSEKFLSSSEKKTQVLNDLTFILQHLHKNILLAKGNVVNYPANVGIRPAGNVLEITQESQTVRYEFGVGVDNKIVRFRVMPLGGTPWQILTESFIDLAVDGMPFGMSLNTNDGGLAVTNLALRLDPTSLADPSTNPEVTTIDNVTGNRTVYFYSLSHSWK